MCTDIIHRIEVRGSVKGPRGWATVEKVNVYFDHPYHAPFDHSLNIDFLAGGTGERLAVELSPESARELVERILATLKEGEAAHAT